MIASEKTLKERIQEATLSSISELCLYLSEMHKILILCVGRWESCLSDSITFGFGNTHVPFLISATVSSGEQRVDSLRLSLSAFPSACFPSLTPTRCPTCFHSPLLSALSFPLSHVRDPVTDAD